MTMSFRNPSRMLRAVLVAGTYSVPGAITGLVLGLVVPYPRTMFVAGLMAGVMAGAWIELR